MSIILASHGGDASLASHYATTSASTHTSFPSLNVPSGRYNRTLRCLLPPPGSQTHHDTGFTSNLNPYVRNAQPVEASETSIQFTKKSLLSPILPCSVALDSGFTHPKTFPKYITATPLSTSHSDYKLSNAANNRHLRLLQSVQLVGDRSTGIVSNTPNATIINIHSTTRAIDAASSSNNDPANKSKDARPHIPLEKVSVVQFSGFTRGQDKFLRHPLDDHSIVPKSSAQPQVSRACVKKSSSAFNNASNTILHDLVRPAPSLITTKPATHDNFVIMKPQLDGFTRGDRIKLESISQVTSTSSNPSH